MPVILDPDHSLVDNTDPAWTAGHVALAALPRLWDAVTEHAPHLAALEVWVTVDSHEHVPAIYLELIVPAAALSGSCAIRVLPFSAELPLQMSLQARLTALVQQYQMGLVLLDALAQWHASLWGCPDGLEPNLRSVGLELQIYTEPHDVVGPRILHRWAVHGSGAQCEWSYFSYTGLLGRLCPARLPLANPPQFLADSLRDFLCHQLQC